MLGKYMRLLCPFYLLALSTSSYLNNSFLCSFSPKNQGWNILVLTSSPSCFQKSKGFRFPKFCLLFKKKFCLLLIILFILRRWTSFASGASVALYVYNLAFYYYFFKTKMYGLFQTTFYFAYMLIFCLTLGILCGTVGYVSSASFVHKIYSRIKLD